MPVAISTESCDASKPRASVKAGSRPYSVEFISPEAKQANTPSGEAATSARRPKGRRSDSAGLPERVKASGMSEDAMPRVASWKTRLLPSCRFSPSGPTALAPQPTTE